MSTLQDLGRMFGKLVDMMVNRKARMAATTFIDGFREDIREAFDRGADPKTGTPWPARKDSLPHKLLQKTGTLKGIALETVDAAQPSGWGVTITLPGPPYAGVHIKGGGRVPQRNFWGVSPATEAATAKQYRDEIVRVCVGG